MGKILMSKKQRKIFEQVDRSHKSKKEMVNKLKEKKKKIE